VAVSDVHLRLVALNVCVLTLKLLHLVPSNHVVYGENVAMLAAGSLIAYSFSQVLEETKGVDVGRITNVAARLAKVIGAEGMAGGEMMDVLYQGKTNNVTLVDLNWVHLHKTASLIQYSVASGAVLAGASPDEIAAVEEYGNNIGLAFQVIDDILDLEQDKAAGKLTYPKLLGIDGARAEARLLIGAAKNSVARFGDNAKVLSSFADFLLGRGQVSSNYTSTSRRFFGFLNPYDR
jgi:geranylgeranyl diphosphate synthase, type II